MPASLSDREPQMRSKTIRRFFHDLGVRQMFSRPRTPADNATIEELLCHHQGRAPLPRINTNPIELITDADAFVVYHNEERLHMGIGLVSSAEKHDGNPE
ncbi:MAG: hypothetical protein ACRDJ0_11520 [Actinomycetota bacterium]